MKKFSLLFLLILSSTQVFAADNKTILITGSSRGIGYALTQKFIQEGYEVIAVTRKPKVLKESANLKIINSDISTKNGRKSVIEFLRKNHLKLDYLVNNAGTLEPIALLQNIKEEELEQMMQINLVAPIMLTSLLLKNKLIDKDTRILNISSIGADSPLPGILAYASSKSGLDGFTKAALTENLIIASVHPGEVDTSMQEQLRKTSNDKLPATEQFQEAEKNGMLISPKISADYLFWLITASDQEYFISKKHNIYDDEHQKYWLNNNKLPGTNR